MTTPTPHGAPELPELLRNFARAVERIAFEMPPPNPYTPRLAQMAGDAIAELNRRAAIQQAAGAVPEGWRLVPVEPTIEMRMAGHVAWMRATNEALEREAQEEVDGPHSNNAAAYRAMLAASPSPLGREAGKEGSSDHLVPCAGGGVTRPASAGEATDVLYCALVELRNSGDESVTITSEMAKALLDYVERLQPFSQWHITHPATHPGAKA